MFGDPQKEPFAVLTFLLAEGWSGDCEKPLPWRDGVHWRGTECDLPMAIRWKCAQIQPYWLGNGPRMSILVRVCDDTGTARRLHSADQSPV